MLTLKQDLPFEFNASAELCKFVTEHVKKDGLSVINLRSSSYHPENGGFRPVEIMVDKLGDYFAIVYYTEFRYYGQGTYAELGKSNNFDFSYGSFQSEHLGVSTMDASFGEMFSLFITNTLNYFSMVMFDDVECCFIGGHLMLHKNLIGGAQ